MIVGAGPAGLATSACLNLKGIPNVLIEREDCCASLWKKRAYDRLKLHLAKEFCQLPHRPFPSSAPTFVPRNDFVDYLDDYCRQMISAFFDINKGKWVVDAHNTLSGTTETFFSTFLVVATGENSEGVIPEIPGLDGYAGVAMHASHYKNGRDFSDKDVMVVGSGNSGMEIAFDLANWGANTSIVVRNPVIFFNINKFFLSISQVLKKNLNIPID